MQRITMRDLNILVARLNKMTNSPETAYTRVDGKLKANIGHFHLDQAYGGIKLVRMDSEGGGINVISTGGYGTKRELYTWLDAYISGLRLQVQA